MIGGNPPVAAADHESAAATDLERTQAIGNGFRPMPAIPVYLATVCLERNRWGSRKPSFQVSHWLPRLAADGFDSVELWENHYLAADADEQARLRAAAGGIAVFNSYAGLGDGDADGQQRRRATEAVLGLRAAAVKYNLGGDPRHLGAYRRNLLAWADDLPSACRLLCECHPGTVLEDPGEAAAFFADLDASRFGVIAHACGEAAEVEPWLTALGPRLRHLHLQLRQPEQVTPLV